MRFDTVILYMFIKKGSASIIIQHICKAESRIKNPESGFHYFPETQIHAHTLWRRQQSEAIDGDQKFSHTRERKANRCR